ncbi:hypothetical protein DL762_009562 [Monosporascus cannonballus]|uniref:Exocyst complex component Sec3 PIP2-binding N-terminal domain-containing protein n=1 Tax=Monosporascus cannonballus TaxID=155416 RepID=A0ABY0GTX5_9PEZI|nr:hypothetical protein DL762_009562 [Monosporascus cannonballus]
MEATQPPPPPPRQNGGPAAYGREKFEEEKRRIVDSCFNKKDVDGSLLETYITHLRITEFASHPPSPPPPEVRKSPAEKPRIIIVAVRKSGRVRIHKSKENTNGTFSIGKTWDLNDLTTIESFTASNLDPQKREWAGDIGFIVHIGKPYYWQARADKEKKFFIASLIKIYGKYTGGNIPQLIGFDPREMDQVLGSRRPAPARPPTAEAGPPPRPLQAMTSQGNLRPVASSERIRPYKPPPPNARSLVSPNGQSSPASSIDSSRMGSQPAPLRRLGPNNISQDSVAASIATTRSDDSGMRRPGSRGNETGSRPPRSRGEDTGSRPPRVRGDEAGALPIRSRGNDVGGRPPPSREGSAGMRARSRGEDVEAVPPRSRGGTPRPPGYGEVGDNPPAPSQLDLPDRKRPPMDPGRPQGVVDNDLVPAPLMSPGSRREPPPRSDERMSPRKPQAGQRLEDAVRETPPLAPLAPSRPPAPEPSPVTTEPPLTPAVEHNPEPTPDAGSARLPSIDASADDRPFTTAVSTPAPDTPQTTAEAEETRPGLGPMIKAKKSKVDLAGTLWKAASAAAAFKPRPGGAGERLREAKKPATDEPDGITSVVPAKPRAAAIPETTPLTEPADQKESEKHTDAVPEVKLTVPNSSRPTSLQASVKESERKKLEATQRDDKPERSPVTGNDAKYFAALGVGTSLLADAPSEFARWLDHFGWVPGEKMRTRNFEEMKLDVDRELNKAQAGGWVARLKEEDERVDAIKKGLDIAITECDELDNLLTLYSVELSTLSDDIAYIEAQGQGLQVQAANQKLLRRELESLLDTCAITSDDLRPLEVAPLETHAGLEEVESTLVILYKAMIKIDPSMMGSGHRSSEDGGTSDHQMSLNPDYGKMRIVQEKREMYLSENAAFLRRFQAFMTQQFAKAAQDIKAALDGTLSKKVDSQHHDVGRETLWKYHPLVLYTREMDAQGWDQLLKIYQEKNLPLYKSEFKHATEAWKRNARKPTGDEVEMLFTTLQEKKEENPMAAARKLTVKRSQTLARTLRSPLGDSKTSLEKGSDNRSHAYEVFASIMDDLLPLVEMEQNFMIDFFHATTLETSDFPDLVSATRPRDRRGGDLRRHRLMEPDRELARRVTRAMEVIFQFLEQDLQVLIAWVLSQDPLQGVGILATLERKHLETTQSNQDFLNSILQKLHSSLESRFSKFVEEQIRAIEETKVKIKKRKGVISFIRVFPSFSAAIENMLVGVDTSSTVRRMVDAEYDRIIRSMFDSLKVIARENPATLTGSGADPEDKEALNYHILLIENMNHFIEDVETRGLEVLEDWKETANSECAEHMGLYLNAVMSRPLGKLLEYLENIEAQLAAGKSPAAIAAQPSNAKAAFNKMLSQFDAREARKGVEALRKRVEKHFGDADDDPSLSRGLVNRVLRECERFYADVEVRISTITTTVYGGDVPFEWPRADIKSAFSAAR